MSQSDLAISIRGLSKSYTIAHGGLKKPSFREVCMDRILNPFHRPQTETFWALKDVSFDVKKGEVVGIIGRNGAGKSTLLKILSRITEPTAGEIDVYGRIGSLLEVGTGFHPELTGRENIYLNGSILGMTRAEITRQFDAIVDFAEIEKFLDTPVKRYSSGMYVRLAFAVAAHLRSEILIIDEVLAVGDVQFQKKCLGKMKDVAEGGRTVFFVSHNLDAIRKLCTRGIHLGGGRALTDSHAVGAIGSYLETSVSQETEREIPVPGQVSVPAFATRIRIEDWNGELTNHFPVGKPWQVRVVFRVERPIDDFVIALGITTSSNQNVRTSWSSSRRLCAGEYEARFRDDKIYMEPGCYGLTVGLSSSGQVLHYLEGVATLTIADISVMCRENIMRLSNCGTILNPLDISINLVEPASPTARADF